MIAVLTTSFIVSLLCFYVAAYARVTAAGFELSRLNRKIRAAEAEEQALLAAIGNLRAPNTVASRALKMEMVPGEPQTLNLVTPQTVPQNASATQDVPSLPEGETVRNNTISPGANRQ